MFLQPPQILAAVSLQRGQIISPTPSVAAVDAMVVEVGCWLSIMRWRGGRTKRRKSGALNEKLDRGVNQQQTVNEEGAAGRRRMCSSSHHVVLIGRKTLEAQRS